MEDNKLNLQNNIDINNIIIEKWNIKALKSIILNIVVLALILIFSIYNDMIFQVVGRIFVSKESVHYLDESYIKTIGLIVFTIFYIIGIALQISIIIMHMVLDIQIKDIYWFVYGGTKKENEYKKLYPNEEKHVYTKNGRIYNIVKNIIDYYFVIAIAILTVIVLFTFILFPAEVNQHSMEKTLSDGNRVLVFVSHKANDGDIVVFKYDENIQKYNSNLEDTLLIKRVIAKEGDSFECIDGYIYVNNVKLEESYVISNNFKINSYTLTDVIMNNSNYEELSYLIQQNGNVIPKGYYLCLGDNRANSHDSEEFGLVYYKQFEGKVKYYNDEFGWHKVN